MTRSIAGTAAVLLICSRSVVLGQTLAEMDHTMWTARDGAPQAIKALAQARDGTLWIGSETGLVNFDGLRFRKFESPLGDPPFPVAAVDSLLVTRDGTLWVGFHQAGAARIKAGRVTVYEKVGQQQRPVVHQPREARDGSIWAIVNMQELVRFDRDGTWHSETPPLTARLTGIFIDTADTLWLAQGGFLYRRPLDQPSYYKTSASVTFGIAFAETPDGHIWFTDMDTPAGRDRTQLLDRQGNVVSVLPFTKFSSGLLYASDGSLILPLQILHGGGLRRFAAEELSARGRSLRPDVLTEEQGLSSNATNTGVIDSHGNIWIGGQRGLDRLRPQHLTPFDRGTSEDRWVVCASAAGELWIANAVNQLYKVSRGTRTLVPGVKDIYALSCQDGGRAWFVDHDGVSAVAAGTITRLPSIPGSRPYGLSRIAAAPDHSVYATVLGTQAAGGGVWHYKDRRWTQLPGEGFGGSPVMPLPYLDSRGRLWIGYRGEQVVMYTQGRAQLFTIDGPGLGYVFALLETSRGLFAAGHGLAVLRDSRFVPLSFADPAFVQGVRGLVQSRNGDLWLNAAGGIVRIPAGELDAGLANSSYAMEADLISEGEFAGSAQVEGRTDTAAIDAEGHLWFATRHGVASLDPERWPIATPLPIVTIRSMATDGQGVDEHGVVDARPRTLVIQYQGINLTAPDNVIYRYQLIGFDEEWQDAGRRTEAIYTRVPPGTYTFMVMASNGDGRWTEPASSKSFTVLPSFYQTRWFAVVIVALGLLVLVVAYRIRIRQISRLMNARLDERVNERTRIARELHDTLLQSFQGLMLRFQSARDLLPAQPAKAVEALDGALERADQAITEGRDAIQNMRSSTVVSNELAQAITTLAEELNNGNGDKGSAMFTVSVEGSPRDLHPIVRDDIHRIAREALRNAFRHAQADRIEAEVTYGPRELRLRIRDNGKGIDPQHLSGGRVRHWGLAGMRERSVQIGAQLNLWSEVGAGTEVELRVPGGVAYTAAGGRGRDSRTHRKESSGS